MGKLMETVSFLPEYGARIIEFVTFYTNLNQINAGSSLLVLLPASVIYYLKTYLHVSGREVKING